MRSDFFLLRWFDEKMKIFLNFHLFNFLKLIYNIFKYFFQILKTQLTFFINNRKAVELAVLLPLLYQYSAFLY